MLDSVDFDGATKCKLNHLEKMNRQEEIQTRTVPRVCSDWWVNFEQWIAHYGTCTLKDHVNAIDDAKCFIKSLKMCVSDIDGAHRKLWGFYHRARGLDPHVAIQLFEECQVGTTQCPHDLPIIMLFKQHLWLDPGVDDTSYETWIQVLDFSLDHVRENFVKGLFNFEFMFTDGRWFTTAPHVDAVLFHYQQMDTLFRRSPAVELMKQKTQCLRDKAAFLLAFRLVDYLDSLLNSDPDCDKEWQCFRNHLQVNVDSIGEITDWFKFVHWPCKMIYITKTKYLRQSMMNGDVQDGE